MTRQETHLVKVMLFRRDGPASEKCADNPRSSADCALSSELDRDFS